MKKYVNPELEVIEIDVDVITTSGEGDDGNYEGGEGGTPGMPM